MKSPRRYAPVGGSLAPVRVAGFRWNGWQPSAVYARSAVNPYDPLWTAYLERRHRPIFRSEARSYLGC